MLARTLNAACLLSILFCLPAVASAAPITGGTGTGGFMAADGVSNLQFWLRGDAGVVTSGSEVTDWLDSSGYGRDTTQASAANRPTVGTRNGLTVVDFAGTERYLERLGFTSSFTQGHLVMALRSDADGGVTLGGPHNIGNNSNSHHPWLDGIIYDNFGTSLRKTTGNPVDPLNQFHIYSAGADNTAWTSRINGVLHFSDANTVGTGFSNHGTTGPNLNVGREQSEWNWGGEIAEFILFDRKLNSVEEVLVENALSAKYAIPLSGSNFYAGDTASKGNYDFDVFGIGNDGTSAVLTSGSAGFGIEVTDGSLTANRWVLAGHKVAINSLVPVETSNEIARGDRWERIWFVDVTGEGVNATLAFDFSDAGLGSPLASDQFTLLYREEEGFDWTILAVSASVAGDLVLFNVAALQDGYYTLGINVGPIIPEPSSLLLLAVGSVLTLQLRRRRRSGE